MTTSPAATDKTPARPTTATPDRPRLAAALAGAATPLLFAGVARAWWGPDASPWAAAALLAGGAAGALLPADRRLTAALRAASAAGLLGVLLVVLGAAPALARLDLLPGLTLAAAGALAGQALAAATRGGERAATRAALGGAALVVALRAPFTGAGPAADVLLGPIALLLLALARPRSAGPGLGRPAPWRLALALAAGAGVGLAAGVAALGASQGAGAPAGAALLVAATLGAWLTGRSALRDRRAPGVAAAVLSLAPGLAGALAFTRVAAWSAPLALAAGLLAGLGLGALVAGQRHARAGGLPAWLAALAAVAAAGAAPPLVARRLAPADAVALAVGQAVPADEALRRAVDAGGMRLRFAHPALPPVRVVDVREGDRAARLLYVGAALRGAVPLEVQAAAPRAAARGGAGALLAAPVLEAALPHLLAPSTPRRVLVVGLEAGVRAGVTLLAPEVEQVLVLEPRAGVVAAHRDPGDLFGVASGRPLEDPRARLVEGPTWPALRAQGRDEVDAVLAGAAALAGDVTAARRAAGVLVLRLERRPTPAGAPPRWDLRARLADLLPRLGPDVLAFWPHRDAPLLLVAGAGPLDASRVAARLAAGGPLRERLAGLGVRGADDLLGLCLAGPAGLQAFAGAPAGAGDDPAALARAAAASLPEALALPADAAARAATLVRLAEEAGRRQAPTASAFARAALRAARTPETLRVLGDALLQEGRAEEAAARWREALTLDPAAVAPRISMAVLHQQRGEPEAARAVLEQALQGDASKDAPLRYALGQVAMAQSDYVRARAEFVKAGALADAPERAVLAGELARRGAQQPDRRLPVEQRLAAVRLRLERAETAIVEGDEEVAGRHRAAAVADLLELADDASALSPEARADVGRLLARGAAVEELEPARAHLYARAAEVLAPLADDPALAVERAVALHLAGRAAEAEALLLEVGRATGARTPRVHAALGDLLASTGRGDAAIEAYERALALGPASSSDANLYLAIASLHHRAGRVDRAIAALEQADRQVPGHPDVLANLGSLYLQQGRDGAALGVWRRFLEVAGARHPLRPRLEAAVRRLE